MRGTHQGQQSARTASTGRTHDRKRPLHHAQHDLLHSGGHPHLRRRDFAIGVLLAAAARPGRAQEPAKQHRIAIIFARPVALIDDSPLFRAFFEELRRLGHVEGQNLAIERYSGGGKPEGYAKVAR